MLHCNRSKKLQVMSGSHNVKIRMGKWRILPAHVQTFPVSEQYVTSVIHAVTHHLHIWTWIQFVLTWWQSGKGRTDFILVVQLWHGWALCIWEVRTAFNCTSELCLWAEKGQSWWCCHSKSSGAPYREAGEVFSSQRSPYSKPPDAGINLYIP